MTQVSKRIQISDAAATTSDATEKQNTNQALTAGVLAFHSDRKIQKHTPPAINEWMISMMASTIFI